MNSDGDIKHGGAIELKKLGYNIPLSDSEAEKLLSIDVSERLGTLVGMRHEILAKKQRVEKYPGQSTRYLVGTNNADRIS